MTDTLQRNDTTEPDEHVVHDGPASNPIVLLAIVAGLVLLGLRFGRFLPVMIVGITVMIFFHELGHFVTAKLTGMKATEFFLGFGPRLWSFKRGETEYGLKLIPAGAYVKIIGMSNLEEVDAADEARAYRNKSYPRRFLVAVAGSAMHYVVAFVLLFAIMVGFGQPDGTKATLAEVYDGLPAHQAGIQVGDRLVSINGESVRDWSDVGPIIRTLGGKTVEVEYLRGDELRRTMATLGWRLNDAGAAAVDGLVRDDMVLSVDGTPIKTYDEFLSLVKPGQKHLLSVNSMDRAGVQTEVEVNATVHAIEPDGARGLIGLKADIPRTPAGAGEALSTSVRGLGVLTTGTVKGLGQLVTGGAFSALFDDPLNGSKEIKGQATNDEERLSAADKAERRPISLIGATRIGTQVGQKEGMASMLELLSGLIIMVGLLNLLPLLPLDGGHILVATYERLRSRRGRPYHADFGKLMPITYAVVALMVGLFAMTAFLDIANPVNYRG